MVEFREITTTLEKIGNSVKNNEIGEFETGHGFKHHYSVAKDALRIARTDKVEVDTNVLLVASCVHDFEQRGGVKPQEMEKFFTEDLQLEDKFVYKVVDAISNHSLDNQPQTVEGEIIWVADKSNYPDPERFRDVVKYVSGLEEVKREKAIKHFYETLAEKWVRGTVEIPQNKLMKKYPTSIKLFSERLGETLDYINGEGNHVFGGWMTLYNEAHEKKGDRE